MRVFVAPRPSDYTEDGRGSGGIWRVILAQARWLPKYGIEIVGSEDECDLVASHAGTLVESKKPYVTHNHGMYWTGDFEWSDGYWHYNGAVIENLRRADIITTPSRWVGYPIQRDMRKNPRIIPHGINPDEFEPQQEHDKYVLWAKPRVDVVCDPRPVNELARRARDIQFLTTFGRPTGNVKVVGAMPYADFQDVLGKAMIWLATARETGDIASREAMVRGIPVLGWNWGATAELVRHKETGYLAEKDDYDDLMVGLEYCIKYREGLGRAAREDILARFSWEHIMGQYAQVYRQAMDENVYPFDVSVIVPTYNYAHFLPECLDSIMEQEFDGDVEVIIVDDCSTDNTQKVLERYEGIKVLRHKINGGLTAALNTGFSAAQGEYALSVDADNLLPPDSLFMLHTALEEKPYLDVASGGLAMYSDNGNHPQATDWPFGTIDPLAQLYHVNQLTSSSMVRMSSVKRLGGYRHRQVKNEDGEFWCRAVSAGLRFEQVTQKPTLIYRWHENNKSKVEGGEDDPEGPLAWNFYYPWQKHHNIMPFASTVPAPRGSWPVRSYDNPHIAVVIPCGPGHAKYLVDALDSVIGQTFQNFECIVANDSGSELDVVSMGHPWVKVVNTAGRQGPAIARNTAISVAEAPLIVPLDADDMLYPNALMDFYKAWLQHPSSLVYMDCDTEDQIGKRKYYHSGPWTWAKIKEQAIYQDTILFAKDWWEAVGGYPTDQPRGGWEDWLFGVKLHIAGIGATWVQQPWGVYRHWTAGEIGQSRNEIDNEGYGTPEFKKRAVEFADWIKRKELAMPCRGCGGGRRTRTVDVRSQVVPVEGDDILVVYEGDREGTFSVNSKYVPRRTYRARRGVPFTVPAGDAWIQNLPGFHKVTEQVDEMRVPTTPPTVPPVKIEQRQPPPVVSFADAITAIKVDDAPYVDAPPRTNAPVETVAPESEPAPPPRLGLTLGDIATVRGLTVKKLMNVGFGNVEEIKEDILNNNGEKLKRIPRVGTRTVTEVMRVLLRA